MQYTFMGYQQEELIKLGLDHIDAILLRYINDFYNTRKMYHKVIDNRIWFWFKYGSVLEELPLLKITTVSCIKQRVAKWIKTELLLKMEARGVDEYIYNGRVFRRNGTYIYLSFNSEKLAILVGGGGIQKTPPAYGVASKSQQGCHVEATPGGTEMPAEDSSTKDPLIKDHSTTDAEGTKTLLEFYEWEFKSDCNAYNKETGKVYNVFKIPDRLPIEILMRIDQIYGHP
jgi:hypothetical protein